MNLSTQSLAFQQHQPSFFASYIPNIADVEEGFHKLVQMTSSWPSSRKQQSERDRFSSTSLGALFSTSSTSTSPSASSPTSSTSSIRRMSATVSPPTCSAENNNCDKINKNRMKSDYGADTDDCETHPPSDNELNEPEPEVGVLLLKMEELNKLNEQDSRSVTSRKSGSSSSCAGGDSPSRGDHSSRHNSCHPDDDENLDLWTIWGDLVKNWEIELRKRPNYVKDLVKRGVPQHFRTITWQLLSCANAQSIHDQYTDYMRQSSPYEKVIMRDIPRTYPELEFFKDHGRGQSALFNVIKAYSIRDTEVGYCQGSAFIVGQLLLQMPEEEAFAVFVRLMEHYRLRELYKPAMTELGLCMFQLECLVQEQMPDLYTHFNNMGFDTSMYASSWFLTLFTTSLPLDLANRIMDIFLLDGIETIFRVAMAILQQARIDLLKLDMEGMLKYFQREIRERFENDHDLLFAVAFQVTLNAKKMKKLEKDYLAKRTKEQEEAVELRRLRTENRLLRQRIDYLEQESSALADRLIKGQVNLAQEAENCISISHELHQLRDINSDAHKRLEDAYETIRELSSRRRDGGAEISHTGIQVDDTSMIEHIHALQQELIETHTREADLENTVRELKLRITELELANKRLKESPPDDGIAGLQEELISVKMREAEASLSLKEMRQKLAELEQQWAKYIHARTFEGQNSAAQHLQHPTSSESMPEISGALAQNASASAPQTARGRLAKFTATLIGATSMDNGEMADSAISARELEDQLMGVRIREADAVAELKEMRQKVMELETQNHVCTNQLKRQDEEVKKLREQFEHNQASEKMLSDQLKEEKRKAMDMQSELNEKTVMQRLKYSEAMQTIAELKQQISHAELKKAEKWTHDQLLKDNLSELDDDSINGGPLRSHSNGDAASLASEDMSALIADVTVRIPTDLLFDEGLMGDDDEDDDEETSSKKERRLRSVGARQKDEKKASVASNIIKQGIIAEDGNETADSGLQLSDN